MKNNGFTLIEVMVAIMIFGILATTLFSTYGALFANTARLERGVDNYGAAKSCFSRMSRDLKSICVAMPPAYSPSDALIDEDKDMFRFEAKTGPSHSIDSQTIRFASLAHINFGHAAQSNGSGSQSAVMNKIARIVYYLDEMEDGTFVLKRSDTPMPGEPFKRKKTDPRLCENIRSIKFEFTDHDSGSRESWDSESSEFEYATPRAVKIRLELVLDPEEPDDALVFETTASIPVFREKTEKTNS